MRTKNTSIGIGTDEEIRFSCFQQAIIITISNKEKNQVLTKAQTFDLECCEVKDGHTNFTDILDHSHNHFQANHVDKKEKETKIFLEHVAIECAKLFQIGTSHNVYLFDCGNVQFLFDK